MLQELEKIEIEIQMSIYEKRCTSEEIAPPVATT